VSGLSAAHEAPQIEWTDARCDGACGNSVRVRGDHKGLVLCEYCEPTSQLAVRAAEVRERIAAEKAKRERQQDDLLAQRLGNIRQRLAPRALLRAGDAAGTKCPLCKKPDVVGDDGRIQHDPSGCGAPAAPPRAPGKRSASEHDDLFIDRRARAYAHEDDD
jgi:hypothetical protein